MQEKGAFERCKWMKAETDVLKDLTEVWDDFPKDVVQWEVRIVGGDQAAGEMESCLGWRGEGN